MYRVDSRVKSKRIENGAYDDDYRQRVDETTGDEKEKRYDEQHRGCGGRVAQQSVRARQKINFTTFDFLHIIKAWNMKGHSRKCSEIFGHILASVNADYWPL
jgi:hypothetical protein